MRSRGWLLLAQCARLAFGPKTSREAVSMKRAFVTLALVANLSMAADPSDAQRIEEATAALPESLRAGASVVMIDTDGHKQVLRPGSNGFVCSPDKPAPGFKVACVEATVNGFFAAVRPIVAQATSKAERRELIDAAIEKGVIKIPTPGSRNYVLSGPDRQRAKLLLTIFLPGATAESTGLSTERSDGTWLMCPGSPGAHIMVGDIPYGQDEDRWKKCAR